MTDAAPPRRAVYCVLSARSLPYARLALDSLARRCLDDLDIVLVTDEEADRAALFETMQSLAIDGRHRWRVHAQRDADERAVERLARHPHLAAFRFGHPCWRKITDPMLFAPPGAEMIVLDPDLYFPNRFRFEPTPATGVLLMHQPPSCLLPPEVVVRAYDSGIRLAHHVDIGVAQLRSDLDLDWLDDLVARLGGRELPRAMHVEAIVWAALAMHAGGGYLDPGHWHCWRNAQWKRLLLRLGAPGPWLLRGERFSTMKCFHGGGIAKWWIPPAVDGGQLPEPTEVSSSRPPLPFEELGRADYEATQRLKRWARRAGYYRLLGR